MKPSAVAAAIQKRVERDTTLSVHARPDYLKAGANLNLVIGDPDIQLAQPEIRTFGGTPFSNLVEMTWELMLVYTRTNWTAAADAFYDTIESLTENLSTPLADETGSLQVIVESIDKSEPFEIEDEDNPVGVSKIINIRTFSRGG